MWEKLKSLFSKKQMSFDYCIHEYQVLERASREVDLTHNAVTYTVEDVYIYCPKCRKRRVVSPLEWRLLSKQQKIDCEFAKLHQIYVEKM